MKRNDYAKLQADKELQEKKEKWFDFNGGINMPPYTVTFFSSYRKYRRIFLKEYKKLGIK